MTEFTEQAAEELQKRMKVYSVKTGTLVNLGETAFRESLPDRHHRFPLAARGETAYIIRQKRTAYGGTFYCVLPLTGHDPASGGMIWMGWLSVREEDIPRLKRASTEIKDADRIAALRRNIEIRLEPYGTAVACHPMDP